MPSVTTSQATPKRILYLGGEWWHK